MTSTTTTPAQITAHVPAARYGQVVTIDGTDYKVIEINLARPNHPVLAPISK
jgi:hypothetical protein